MTDIRDKIAKLLALASSPVEAEAQAALIKAHELMVKHKIDEKDFGIDKPREIKHLLTEYKYSGRNNPWMAELVKITATNCCCDNYINRGYGSQTRQVCLVGFEDDVTACKELLDYAVEYLRGRKEMLQRDYFMYPQREITIMADSFGYGFCSELKTKFEEEYIEHPEYALAVVTPKEASGYVENLSKTGYDPVAAERIDKSSYEEGFEADHTFTKRMKLEEELT